MGDRVLRGLNHIPEIVRSMESEWAMFHTAIAEAAARSTGSQVASVSLVGNPRTQWWTPEVKGAIKLKKGTYKSWLAFGFGNCYPLAK